MVFSSYEFILVFLPITLLLTFLVRKLADTRATLMMLVIASWVFYAHWDWRFLPLLLLSTFGNFALAKMLASSHARKKAVLITGIAANLALLAYFKYWNFFIDNVEALTGTDYNFAYVILPIGISFFTFQQIAYLVDTAREGDSGYNIVEFALFVSFFPQLIAGPIVHHKELMPQLTRSDIGRFQFDHLSAGIVVFVIGLAKKVLIADTLAGYADPLFAAAAAGTELSMLEAWGATLLYGLQLYFDFSGYADMAIGLGMMFGIILPANFNRPYTATSVRDFWRRWHMTLSSFLRDYVYIPLGGSRRGPVRQCINLMTTMVLGGIWHGAGWAFLWWGALHGGYMVIERMLEGLRRRGLWPKMTGFVGRNLAWVAMLVAVFFAWVPFRAPDLATAFIIWEGMFSGPLLPQAFESQLPGVISGLIVSVGFEMSGASIIALRDWVVCMPLLIVSFILSLILPNGRRLAELVLPTEMGVSKRSPVVAALSGAAMSLLFVSSLIYLSYNTVFLYFQF